VVLAVIGAVIARPVMHAVTAVGHAAGEVLHVLLIAVEVTGLTAAAVTTVTLTAVVAVKLCRHQANRQLERRQAERAKVAAILRRELEKPPVWQATVIPPASPSSSTTGRSRGREAGSVNRVPSRGVTISAHFVNGGELMRFITTTVPAVAAAALVTMLAGCGSSPLTVSGTVITTGAGDCASGQLPAVIQPGQTVDVVNGSGTVLGSGTLASAKTDTAHKIDGIPGCSLAFSIGDVTPSKLYGIRLNGISGTYWSHSPTGIAFYAGLPD
jgi:hypothetical protein